MRNPRLSVFILALTTLLGTRSAMASNDEPPEVLRARELIGLLAEGKFDQFVSAGNEAIQRTVTAEHADRLWSAILMRCGKYEERITVRTLPTGECRIVGLALHFEHAVQPVRVEIDPQGRLAGFWLDPAEMTRPYEPPPYANPTRYEEQVVSIPAELPLPATLTIPVGSGPHPAVVLVHAAGPLDRDSTIGVRRPFRDLALGLATRGLGGVCRGGGVGGGWGGGGGGGGVGGALANCERSHIYRAMGWWPPDGWSFSSIAIDDTLAALELLRNHSQIDSQRLYVLGHGLGGMAAPHAAERDGRLAGIVIVGCGARSVLDIMLDESRYLARLDGVVSARENEQLARLTQYFTAIRAGRLADVPPTANIPVQFLAEVHQLDVLATVGRLKTTVLVVLGGRDFQTTTEDQSLWAQALAARPQSDFKVLEDLDHTLVAGSGPASPDDYLQPGHVDAAVIDLLADWLRRPAREQ
jgi:dienelactone hydrolase